MKPSFQKISGLLVIFSIVIFTSCGKQRDLVRITGIEVSIHPFREGANSKCVDLTEVDNYIANSPLVLKFDFIKEYYSDDESSSRFARMSIEGLRGSKEKITNVVFKINDQEIALSDIVSIDSLEGFMSNESRNGSCQDSECNCYMAYSVSSFDSLIHVINENLIIKDYKQNLLSNYYSNAPFIFIIPNFNLPENSKSITMNTRLMMDDGKVLTHSSNTLNVVAEL